jgi:hypothetical protein
VFPTVARWFVLDARESVDKCVQVRAALRCVIPYVLERMLYVVGYRGTFLRWVGGLSVEVGKWIDDS